MAERLVAMTVAERLALPWLHPGRADVIDAGALILSRVLRRTPVEHLVVSESDILDGIAWSSAFNRRPPGYRTGMTNRSQQTDEPLGAIVHRLVGADPRAGAQRDRLAQAELTEKGKHAGLGIGLFSGAGLLALYGARGTVHDRGHRAGPRAAAVAGRTDRDRGAVRRRGRRRPGRQEAGRQATPPRRRRRSPGIKQDVEAVKGNH